MRIRPVREEMARRLSDIVLRRTGIATLGDPGEEILKRVAEIAARELKWNRKKIRQEVALTRERLKIPDDTESIAA